MVNNDKRDPRSKVLADSWYRRCWTDLGSFMTRSRQLRKRPTELLELQFEMLSALREVQESKATLERELADHVGDESGDVEQLEVSVAVAKRLARVIKEIGDGMAWRALNYDRPVICELASKPQTGHVEVESAVQELNAAAAHVERTGDIVVMNDLTNFLRYGDYTCVGGGSVTLMEWKGGTAARRSRRAKRQRRKVESVVEFLNTGVRYLEDRRQLLLRQSVRANTHLRTVAELIREAKQRGVAHARLSQCLAVDVHYLDLLSEVGDRREMSQLFHNPFRQTREAVSHRSLDLFDRFSPNRAPYSIYPFGDQGCTDIMTGAVCLTSYFSYRNLAQCLKRRGLSVSLPQHADLGAYLSLSIGDRRRADDRVAIRVWRPEDAQAVLVYLATTLRMFAEFLDEGPFADAVEQLFSRQHLFEQDEGSVMRFPAFANEADLWD
jgi:hypothetical protein